ncbi:nuclease [Gloeomargarita lithophora Alchichica-D10]|uniref:sulfiredoxin n=1 Tax=Gloeomargarita lithophora Alchichica-D10 TaxID=1188229 RepID=A0A1J0ACM1_9CYAN|nr:sulfiredoxin [Gloeomargarita lithophora]APB33667.1 nuclease [Gloeomargarita lithophora Alchichica-D10]
MQIMELPLAQIRRPLPRRTDPAKVRQLMASISTIGQQEPIEVLEVNGQYYGFSGCHRYEALQRLERPTIRCRVRRATPEVLRLHLA